MIAVCGIHKFVENCFTRQASEKNDVLADAKFVVPFRQKTKSLGMFQLTKKLCKAENSFDKDIASTRTQFPFLFHENRKDIVTA